MSKHIDNMNDQNDPLDTNKLLKPDPIHMSMWAMAVAACALGASGTYKTGSPYWIILLGFGFAMIGSGYGKLTADPLRVVGLITWFGIRTTHYVYGIFLLPKFFLLDVIKIEFKMVEKSFDVALTTADDPNTPETDRQRVNGRCSVDYVSDPEHFGEFLDAGQYAGVEKLLFGIVEVAVQNAVRKEKITLHAAETDLKAISDVILADLKRAVRGLGILVTRVQMIITPPKVITDARLSAETVREQMNGAAEQYRDVAKMAAEMQERATGVRVDATHPLQKVYLDAATDFAQVYLKQVTAIKTSGSGSKPLIMTGDNT